MTLTIDIAPDLEGALVEAARRRGQTPTEAAGAALRSVFGGGAITLDTLLTESADETRDQAALSASAFLAGAEATRHAWDTPEEDAAWAHLQ